jgi:hypothetical protein
LCWTTNRVATSWAPLAMLERVAAMAASPVADRRIVMGLQRLAALDDKREVTDRTGTTRPSVAPRRADAASIWTGYRSLRTDLVRRLDKGASTSTQRIAVLAY